MQYLYMINEDCSQQAEEWVNRKQKTFFLTVNT